MDTRAPAGYVDGLNLYAAYFDVNGVDVDGLSALPDLNDGWDMTLSLYNKYMPRSHGKWNQWNITSQINSPFSDARALAIDKNISRLKRHAKLNKIYTTESWLFMYAKENPVYSNAVAALEGRLVSRSDGYSIGQENALEAARDHANDLFRKGKITHKQINQILDSIPLSSGGKFRLKDSYIDRNGHSQHISDRARIETSHNRRDLLNDPRYQHNQKWIDGSLSAGSVIAGIAGISTGGSTTIAFYATGFIIDGYAYLRSTDGKSIVEGDYVGTIGPDILATVGLTLTGKAKLGIDVTALTWTTINAYNTMK